MMLSKIIPKANNENEKIEENFEPVDKETIKKVIKLVETAYDVGCDFELCLELSIGEFAINAASYNGIKLIQNKKENDKLLIQYKNMLISNDTFIDLEHIKHINLNLTFSDKGVEYV